MTLRMKKNMGGTDRIIRLTLAAILAFLTYSGTIPSNIAWLTYGVAAIFTLTSLISFCPLYTLLGFSTCPRN